MRKWMRDRARRRKKGAPAPETESIGRTGQAKASVPVAGGGVLQPAYPEDLPPAREAEARTVPPPPAKPAPPPSPRPGAPSLRSKGGIASPPAPRRMETQPETPGAPSLRSKGGIASPPAPRRMEMETQPETPGAPSLRSKGGIASPPAPRRMEMETQPETPSAPPAAAAEATGHAPAKPSERAPRGVVVLAIGLPGSGKTTWFKRRGVTPLSSDLLRNILFDDITEQRYQGLVFSTLHSLLRARLIAKMPWNYVDATNLSPRERRQWIKMSKSFGYEVHAVFFDVPVEVCLERNRRRERVVSEDVMQRMAAKLRAPTFDEGFAKIVVVRVKQAKEA